MILLDLHLPLVDGTEVLRAIRADPRTRSIPVVVLISSSHERDVVESLSLGVHSCIPKPVVLEPVHRRNEKDRDVLAAAQPPCCADLPLTHFYLRPRTP